MKKLLAMCLATVMAVSLFSGCGSLTEDSSSNKPSNTSSPATTDVGTLTETKWEDSSIRVGIDLDPGTLGPYETNNTGRKQTLYEVYETLAMYQGRGGEIKGVLAKNWYEEAARTYIVELYDYIYDTNGNQITADDVIFSFDAGMQTYKRYLKYIESIEKVDEFTLRIVVNSDDVGTFDHILCQCWIIDQASYESSGDGMAAEPIGTGPYKMISYVEGSKLIMEAKDDYWQTDESLRVKYQYQNVKTVEFIVITEATQRSIALETGTVDIVSGLSYAAATRFMDDDNFNVTTATDNNCRTFFLNCNEASICSNELVRQAILYAFDSQGLVDGVLDGAAEVAFAFGGAVYPDVYSTWDDGDYYAYDTAKAKALLEEAGYGKGCTVRLLTNTNEINGKIASILQGYLSQVGITLEIMQYEETLAKTYMHDFTMFDIYLAYAGAPDYIVIGWNSYLSNTIYDDGLNYCGINDPQLESLLQTAMNGNTHSEETMTELYNYMTDNAYVYGLFSPYLYTVSNKSVTSACVNHDNWLLPGCNTYLWN